MKRKEKKREGFSREAVRKGRCAMCCTLRTDRSTWAGHKAEILILLFHRNVVTEEFVFERAGD